MELQWAARRDQGKRFTSIYVLWGHYICWREITDTGKIQQDEKYFLFAACADSAATIRPSGLISEQGTLARIDAVRREEV